MAIYTSKEKGFGQHCHWLSYKAQFLNLGCYYFIVCGVVEELYSEIVTVILGSWNPLEMFKVSAMVISFIIGIARLEKVLVEISVLIQLWSKELKDMVHSRLLLLNMLRIKMPSNVLFAPPSNHCGLERIQNDSPCSGTRSESSSAFTKFASLSVFAVSSSSSKGLFSWICIRYKIGYNSCFKECLASNKVNRLSLSPTVTPLSWRFPSIPKT